VAPSSTPPGNFRLPPTPSRWSFNLVALCARRTTTISHRRLSCIGKARLRASCLIARHGRYLKRDPCPSAEALRSPAGSRAAECLGGLHDHRRNQGERRDDAELGEPPRLRPRRLVGAGSGKSPCREAPPTRARGRRSVRGLRQAGARAERIENTKVSSASAIMANAAICAPSDASSRPMTYAPVAAKPTATRRVSNPNRG
jgi:hypothetical protein